MPHKRFVLLSCLLLSSWPVGMLEAQAPYEPPKQIFTPTATPAPEVGTPAVVLEAPSEPEVPPTEPPPTATPRPRISAPPPIEAQQWRYGADGQIEWGQENAAQPEAAVQDTPKPEPTPRPIGKTTLRAEQPRGTFLRSNYTILSSVSVRVKNHGIYEAKNVVVKARMPGWKSSVLLYGPTDLPAEATAEYTATPNEIVTVAGNIMVELSCENCRN